MGTLMNAQFFTPVVNENTPTRGVSLVINQGLAYAALWSTRE